MKAAIKKPKPTAGGGNEVLSFRQIRNRVGEGWAIIENPEWNGAIFLRGELLYHSLNKDEAVEEFCKRKEKHLFFMHCRKPDPNTVYIL